MPTPARLLEDMITRLQILTVLALLYCLPVTAQTGISTIKFDNVSIKDGLSQSSPNCILQDHRGLLWIGTDDGLNKYDGYEFRVYKPDQHDNYSISNSRILSLCADPSGDIWLGTNGGGLNRYDRDHDRFTHFLTDDTDSATIAGDIVYCLMVVEDSLLWIGTNNGLSVLDIRKNRVIPREQLPSALSQIYGLDILSMAIDKNNVIWLGVETGLFHYDQAKMKLEAVNFPGDNSHLPAGVGVTVLMSDSKNNLWVGTSSGIAFMKNGAEIFTRPAGIPVSGNNASNGIIKAILEDDNNNIWIGSFGSGLDIYSPISGELMNFVYDYNNPYSLSSNEVLSLFIDHSGIVWAGTNGLDKYNRRKEKFTLYDYVPYTREKLIFRNIHPIYEDFHGILWVGSKADGLHVLDRKNRDYFHLTHIPGNANSLSSNHIRYVKEFPEGTLWVGTEDQGLNRIILDEARKPVRFKSYQSEANNPNSITSNKIYSIFNDKNGKLWIGTDNGLTIMDTETETFTRYLPDPDNPNSISNTTVFSIFGDNSGEIWLATDFGINRYNAATGGFEHFIQNENDTNSLIHNEILSFYEDRKGDLWIGTYGKGLEKYDRKNGIFVHFANTKGLSTAVIYGILADETDNLWLSTNNGIIKFNPSTGEINQFTIEDGLQSNEFNGNSYFKSHTGEMFFGGQYGFNCFYPARVIIDTVAPAIILSDLQVHNRSVIPGEHSPIDKHISEVNEIRLNYKENNFTLYFSALHFGNPARNSYKYKLEGFDDDWVEVGNKRFVSYTSLPYKNYVFRVIASNTDGVWNEKGLSVKIRIKPPFWSTLWFRIFFILSVLALVVYLVRWRMNNVELQKRTFEEKFEASTKELEEARQQLEIQHDEIVVQKRELKLREKDQENLLWFNQGLGLFSDIMSKHKDDLTRLCRITIEQLVEYVDAQQGGIFLLNDEKEDDQYLELVAHYAFNTDKANHRFGIGEGYVGTCFFERHIIEVDNITDGYAELHSGLGKENLRHVLLVPLKINEQCIGVIELGSFRKLKGYRVSFIEKLMETYASIINTEKANAKLKKLIEHSTRQAKELQEREEQMRMNLEEMMATQEESARREDELINLAEESATQEEKLRNEIELLKARITNPDGKGQDT
jgi:ligand-binding sensor domain-containing protein